MKLPYQQKVNTQYGSPMGRYSDTPANFEGRKVHLRHVPLVDGCYDQGGAYWGSPSNLYCAWSDEIESEFGHEEYIVTYFRASSREAAKKELPDTCIFYK